jgi:hypothetical protein
MTDPVAEPFGREEILDKPGIIGARWWQRSLQTAENAVSRRKAVQALLLTGGALGGMGLLAAMVSRGSSDEFRYESRPALDLQKEYGWSFGATTESVTFDGISKRPFDRAALAHLAEDLKPAVAEHAPWYVPTLLQSTNAAPRSTPGEDTSPPIPLATVLAPIFTPAMAAAYHRGRALGSLFRAAQVPVMVIVDLPGPEAVAFAAGASPAFDPVFGFDNWPHPRGVVPAHQALAAAAYYQPLFAKRAPGRAPPMLVLDRRRLTPYTDDASQFDNRHVARLPGVAALRQLGITRVLYVATSGSTDHELDDLNDDFVLYARAAIDVKLVGADAFGPDAADGSAPTSSSTTPDDDRPRYYYGNQAASDGWFWHDYPWRSVPSGATAPRRWLAGSEWVPTPRATEFSTGAPGPSSVRPRPSGFGTVPVVVSIATGLLLGAKLFRSGSWNRTWGSTGG